MDRFPGQIPNLVLRMTEDGRVTCANESSAPIRAALHAQVGDTPEHDRLVELKAAAAATSAERIELTEGHRTFALLPVHVPDLSVYNLYGTDITAEKVVERFPA